MNSRGRRLAEGWLGDVLAQLAEVHRHPAPDDTPYPHITIALRPGRDLRGVGGPSGVERLSYDVSAWDIGDDASAALALSEQIQIALDGVPPVMRDGGYINACWRTNPIPIDVIVEGDQRYQRAGYEYAIETVTTN